MKTPAWVFFNLIKTLDSLRFPVNLVSGTKTRQARRGQQGVPIMKMTWLATVSALTLTACDQSPEPAPETTSTEEVAESTPTAPALSAEEKSKIDSETDLEKLVQLYKSSSGEKKRYTEERAISILSTTTDERAVDKVYWSYRTPSRLRIAVIDAQTRLNPDRM